MAWKRKKKLLDSKFDDEGCYALLEGWSNQGASTSNSAHCANIKSGPTVL